MAQIGNIPEILRVKKHLEELKTKGLVENWELPYENLLTRVSAAIFFLTPKNEDKCEEIWNELKTYPDFSFRENTEKKLSQLKYRIEFKKEDGSL